MATRRFRLVMLHRWLRHAGCFYQSEALGSDVANPRQRHAAGITCPSLFACSRIPVSPSYLVPAGKTRPCLSSTESLRIRSWMLLARLPKMRRWPPQTTDEPRLLAAENPAEQTTRPVTHPQTPCGWLESVRHLGVRDCGPPQVRTPSPSHWGKLIGAFDASRFQQR